MKQLPIKQLPLIKTRYIHEDTPYYCQWESRDLVSKFLNGKAAPVDDPHWKRSGASSPEEYVDWSWSACGMACLKMILADRRQKAIPLVTLAKASLNYGCYKLPLKDHRGLYYQPFAKFAEKEFDLKVTVSAALTLAEIMATLSNDGYVIASVSPKIRDLTSHPKNKTGHLILIIGYDKDQEMLYYHNPSGDTKKSQEGVEISFKDFKRYFGNRGILVT